MIFGFWGHQNVFLKFQNILKFWTQNSEKIQVTLSRGGQNLGFLIEWIFCWIEYSQIQIFESIFELNFPDKKVIDKLN